MESESLSEVVLDSLAHLICSDNTKDTEVSPIHRIPATIFDGFMPVIGDGIILAGDNVSDQPVWPVDVTIACPIGPESEWPEGSWQFKRFKTLKPAEWRGKIHKVFPRMLDISILTTTPNAKMVGARLPYAIAKDQLISVPRTNSGTRISGAGDFVYTTDPSYFGSGAGGGIETDRAIVEGVRILGGFALRRRYYWSVLLGEGKGPRARFLTDAFGMREVFRLRDIPPGRARRAALLNWVREHWRKRRDPGANDRTWIEAYLRGAKSFEWNDLVCRIEPSQQDAEWLAAKRSG